MTSESTEWTVVEQLALDEAIRANPKVDGSGAKERWTSISALLPGRSMRECVERYKDIRQRLQRQTTVTASSATTKEAEVTNGVSGHPPPLAPPPPSAQAATPASKSLLGLSVGYVPPNPRPGWDQASSLSPQLPMPPSSSNGHKINCENRAGKGEKAAGGGGANMSSAKGKSREGSDRGGEKDSSIRGIGGWGVTMIDYDDDLGRGNQHEVGRGGGGGGSGGGGGGWWTKLKDVDDPIRFVK